MMMMMMTSKMNVKQHTVEVSRKQATAHNSAVVGSP